MANQKHLDILKQGVYAWNEWRKKHRRLQADLSEAHLFMASLSRVNLSKADLSRADLWKADLSEANLVKVNLSKAYLKRADLSGADLSGADLSGADLRWANLSRANLSGVDLSGADLSKAKLSGAKLSGAKLSRANLTRTHLNRANLSEATLHQAILCEANLFMADLSRANLSEADLKRAYLYDAVLNEANLTGATLDGAILSETHINKANLSHASLIHASLIHSHLNRAVLTETNLSGADLSWAILSEADLNKANLTGCFIYAISAWDVYLEKTIQSGLIITKEGEPTITVDNLEVAQFIYLLLNNQKIRQTIDTITSQVVLILGSFPPDRKEVRDALSTELHSQKYSPVVFNFEGADNKDFTATVRTLANMARFVLIDLTDLDDAIHEIADAIVPRCVVPIRPLLLLGEHRQEYELFRELQHKYRWVLAPYRYKDLPDLHTSFQEKIIQPIHEKIIELKQKKPLKMFIGYAPEDKNTLNTLKTHFRPLERAGLIEVWNDQDVAPGEEKGKEIERQLSDARLILLLISPDFLSSHDCYDLQMSMALERYEQAEARVIPILLRPCAWQSTPLKELQPLPKDGKPISKHNKDEVFFEVSEEIAEVIKILG